MRIWPGLIVVIAVAALLLGPIISTLPVDQYFANHKTWDFFRTLKMTIRYELPGVFLANPLPKAVNGSLWTIPLEVRWYLILIVLSVIGLLRHRRLLFLSAVTFAIFVFVIKDPEHSPSRKFIYEFGAFFCYGVCLHYLRLFLTKYIKPFFAVVSLATITLLAIDYAYAALFVGLPPLLVFFGSASTPYIRQAGRFGDFSYGIYIYAFPVQQTIVMLTGNSLSVWAALALSTLATAAFTYLSWYFVERPALSLKRYLVKDDRRLTQMWCQLTNEKSPAPTARTFRVD